MEISRDLLLRREKEKQVTDQHEFVGSNLYANTFVFVFLNIGTFWIQITLICVNTCTEQTSQAAYQGASLEGEPKQYRVDGNTGPVGSGSTRDRPVVTSDQRRTASSGRNGNILSPSTRGNSQLRRQARVQLGDNSLGSSALSASPLVRAVCCAKT